MAHLYHVIRPDPVRECMPRWVRGQVNCSLLDPVEPLGRRVQHYAHPYLCARDVPRLAFL